MAGLIGMIRHGFFGPTDRVLVLHTGGSAARSDTYPATMP